MQKLIASLQLHPVKSVIALSAVIIVIMAVCWIWTDGGKTASAEELLLFSQEIQLLEDISVKKSEVIQAQKNLVDFKERLRQRKANGK